MNEHAEDLRVGDRVQIVPSENFTSFFVGRQGVLVRFTKPYWLAKVLIEDHGDEPVTFWVEELRVLSRKPTTKEAA